MASRTSFRNLALLLTGALAGVVVGFLPRAGIAAAQPEGIARWEYATLSVVGTEARLWTSQGGYILEGQFAQNPEPYLNNRNRRAVRPVIVTHLNAAADMGWEVVESREQSHEVTFIMRRAR